MTEPRIVARPRNYAEFCAAIRARVVELQISYETVDKVAGLAERATNKILAENPSKHFGPMSWGSILGTLGLDVVLIENPQALERAKRNKDWTKRERAARVLNGAEHAPITVCLTRRFMRRIAKKGVIERMKKVTPEQRSAIAKNAANTRWHKPNVTEVTPQKPRALRRP